MGRLLQHPGRVGCVKYKNFILPPVFTKRLGDVYHDELERITEEVGSSARALKLVTRDQNHVRFHLPVQTENPDAVVWSVVRKLSDKIGEQLTTHLPAIAKANPLHQGGSSTASTSTRPRASGYPTGSPGTRSVATFSTGSRRRSADLGAR